MASVLSVSIKYATNGDDITEFSPPLNLEILGLVPKLNIDIRSSFSPLHCFLFRYVFLFTSLTFNVLFIYLLLSTVMRLKIQLFCYDKLFLKYMGKYRWEIRCTIRYFRVILTQCTLNNCPLWPWTKKCFVSEASRRKLSCVHLEGDKLVKSFSCWQKCLLALFSDSRPNSGVNVIC